MWGNVANLQILNAVIFTLFITKVLLSYVISTRPLVYRRLEFYLDDMAAIHTY